MVNPQRYSSKNPNITTVSLVTFHGPKFSLEETILLSNSEFIYTARTFDIDDTNELSDHGLVCSPSSFGFTKERAEKVFPHYIYPNCSDVTGIKESSLHINKTTDQIYMTCDNEKFLYGPFSDYKLINHVDTKFLEHSSKDPLTYKNVEFGLGSCKNDKIKYMHAALEPSFNEGAYNYAKQKVKSGNPTIIYFLTLDSISRRHFFRKLKKTVEYFNNFHKIHPDLAIYDFKLHSTFGDTSIENQVPILGKFENYAKAFKGNQFVDKLGKAAI